MAVRSSGLVLLTLVVAAIAGGVAYQQTDRMSVIVGTVAGAFGLGVALIARQRRRSTFRRREEVVRVLSLPVLASVPLMESARESRAARRERWFLRGGSMIVVIGTAATGLRAAMQF